MDIPATIEPGKPIEIQICPFGEFAKNHTDGTQSVQVCDAVGFRRVVSAWVAAGKQKILMDFDHDRIHTLAGGWIIDLRVDPADGLIAMVDFTPAGAAAVNKGEYRFVSVDWDVSDADNRPIRLRTVGMTNRKNIPVRPILNSTEGDRSPNDPNQNQRKTQMDKIAQALGLDPNAAEDAVLAAIGELVAKAKAAEEAALDSEAKSVAKDNATRIENSEEFIKTYKTNPSAVKATLATLKAEKPAMPGTHRVTNSEEAADATPSTGRKFKDKESATLALAQQPVGKRREFFAAHQADFQA